MNLRLAMLALALAQAGCLSIRPRVVSRKTQIENQVVGELARLEGDLLLVSSVRGTGADPNDLSPAQREALVAMMDRAFRRDDIEALKRQQVVGEGTDARLFLFLRRMQGSADDKARVRKLVIAENADRDVLLQRIVDMNPGLGPTDLPEVRRLVHELEVEASAAGTLVQDAQGEWAEKADPRQAEGG